MFKVEFSQNLEEVEYDVFAKGNLIYERCVRAFEPKRKDLLKYTLSKTVELAFVPQVGMTYWFGDMDSFMVTAEFVSWSEEKQSFRVSGSSRDSTVRIGDNDTESGIEAEVRLAIAAGFKINVKRVGNEWMIDE